MLTSTEKILFRHTKQLFDLIGKMGKILWKKIDRWINICACLKHDTLQMKTSIQNQIWLWQEWKITPYVCYLCCYFNSTHNKQQATTTSIRKLLKNNLDKHTGFMFQALCFVRKKKFEFIHISCFNDHIHSSSLLLRKHKNSNKNFQTHVGCLKWKTKTNKKNNLICSS